SNACSSSVSTSAMVDTTCWPSTTRQQVPEARRFSEVSAASVQVANDVHQPGDRGDLRERCGAKRHVVVAQPRASGVNVAVDERIERPIEAEAQHGEPGRLASGT